MSRKDDCILTKEGEKMRLDFWRRRCYTKEMVRWKVRPDGKPGHNKKFVLT